MYDCCGHMPTHTLQRMTQRKHRMHPGIRAGSRGCSRNSLPHPETRPLAALAVHTHLIPGRLPTRTMVEVLVFSPPPRTF